LIDANGVPSSSPALFFGCPRTTCKLSYLEQQVTWDRRDDRLEPQRGYYLSISFQEGGGPLGGTFSYLRVEPDARFYASFFKGQRLTLAARVHFGSLFPASGQTSPIISRFYAGGAASERGFNYRRLSPLFAAGTSTVPPHNGLITTLGAPDGITVPIGGNGLAEGSFEIRYNITGNLVLATFLDMGFVTVDNLVDGWRRQPNYFFGNMQYAVGLGLRYRTIVGPIRLDIARRLPIGPPLTIVNQPIPVNLPAADTTCFGIGFLGGKGTRAGSPEGVCAFHLSIGEAF
jgi:translocation and assembly module TamA